MIPALGAGGPGFKSRFSPCFCVSFNFYLFLKSFQNPKIYYTQNNFIPQKSFLFRGHSELNQGPAGLQPDALPLSYIPFCSITRQNKSNKHTNSLANTS